MKIIKIIFGTILTLLAFDFFGFVLWILSGQVPQSDFYVGVFTVEILKLII